MEKDLFFRRRYKSGERYRPRSLAVGELGLRAVARIVGRECCLEREPRADHLKVEKLKLEAIIVRDSRNEDSDKGNIWAMPLKPNDYEQLRARLAEGDSIYVFLTERDGVITNSW